MKISLLSKKIIFSIIFLPLTFVFVPHLNRSVDKSSFNNYSSMLIPLDEEYADYTIEEVAAGGNHSGAIINDGTGEDGDHLYTWGKNDRGQLGLGERATNKYDTPQEVTGLPKGDMEFLSMGVDHTAVVVNGLLYTWGDNSKGQLGLNDKRGDDGPTTESYNTPQLVKPISGSSESIDGDIIDVSLGGNTSAVIIYDGKDVENGEAVYTWGDDTKGQLGNGFYVDDAKPDEQQPSWANTPQEIYWTNAVPGNDQEADAIETPTDFVQISIGENHSSVIVDNDEGNVLYMWGDNSDRQLGIDNLEQAEKQAEKQAENNNHYYPVSPTPFPSTKQGSIEQISMGSNSSSAVVGNELYTWGSNDKGQLGLSQIPKKDIYSVPTKVEDLPTGNIDQISMGADHTAATVDDTLYTWGNNFKGQLGYSTTNDWSSEPKKVGALPEGNVKTISMGNNYSFAVVSSKTNGDYLYAWGKNKDGQLGLGEAAETEYTTPQQVGPKHTPPDIPFTQQWYFYLIIVLIIAFVVALISATAILTIRKKRAVN